MDKNKIQHIFFDLDNTLWDHRGNSKIVLGKMFKTYEITAKYGIEFEKWHDFYYDHNELLWERLREGKITKEELRDQRFYIPFANFGVKDFALSNEFEEVYLKEIGKMSGTVEGAEELLEYLSKNYTLHIITNGFIEVSEAKIVNAKIDHYFASLTSADELGVRKPDPRVFTLAMEKAGAAKENSIIIGDDWIADIIGGTGFGWKAIFLDCFRDENHLKGVPNVYKLLEIKNYL